VLAAYDWRYVAIPNVLRPRIQKRFDRLVCEHLSPAHRTAAGLRALPGVAKAFASSQASWRFYSNPLITLRGIMKPLLAAGREAVASECESFVLVAHDWSHLRYKHAGKKDRIVSTGKEPTGYGLQAALLMSDRTGAPLAPVNLSLEAADGVHCTRFGSVRPRESQLDELEPVIKFVEAQRFDKPAVHIIDAEADSIWHYRQWSEKTGRYFLVRADDRKVQHGDQDCFISELQQQLKAADAFEPTREVTVRGEQGRQWIAERAVTLTRAARPNRRGDPSRRSIPGRPLTLRLIISEIRNHEDQVIAVWRLLTNVPSDVPAEQIALWYYWRWNIESYFKLLKSAGQELENWQQATAEAVARRLVVASMACVVVWKLARIETPEAEELRNLLIRLSGRQMKRTKPFTYPALLAGFWVLLAMLDVLEQHDPDDLRRLLEHVLGQSRAGPNNAS